MHAGIYCGNAITLVNECVRDKWQGPYINNLITKERIKRCCMCRNTIMLCMRHLSIYAYFVRKLCGFSHVLAYVLERKFMCFLYITGAKIY